MNTLLYARVSTDKQAEKELSIPAQLQAMRDHARQHGWTVIEEFIEPGASATTAQRRELQRLLARVTGDGPKVDVVLVQKLDRMARNVEDHVMIRAMLKRAGVRLASVVENVDESASGQLIENIMASIAQFYSGNLADEVRKGMRQKVLKGGWPHQPPRGYVVARLHDRRQTRVEIHPKDGPLIRSTFEMYATGWYSIKTLAGRLFRHGLVSGTGGPLAHSHLRSLLTNPFYAGRLRWSDLDVEGNHPPLVSLSLFEKVQQVIKSKYRNPGTRGGVNGFPLRGLAICATCRGNMTGERHEGRWGYYRCGRNAYRKELCRSKFCNADRAHGDVERICKQIRISQETADAIRNEANKLIERRLEEAQRRRMLMEAEQARLLAQEMKLTEAFTAGDISGDVYKAKNADIRKKRVDTVEKLGRTALSRPALIAKVDEVLSLATSLWDLYDQFPDEKRTQLLRQAFSAVVLGPEGVVGFTLRQPLDRLVKTYTRTSDSQREADQIAKAILDAPATGATISAEAAA